LVFIYPPSAALCPLVDDTAESLRSHVIASSLAPRGGQQPSPTDQHFTLFGIDGALKRLEKLADAILYATEESLHRRVRVFAAKNRDILFERVVCLTLMTRFPGILSKSDCELILGQLSHDGEAADGGEYATRLQDLTKSGTLPGLFQALFETTTFRHYRMVYERQRRLKDLNQNTQDATAEEPPDLQNKTSSSESPRDSKHRSPASAVAPVLTSKSLRSISDDSQSQPTLPNTIDGVKFRAKMEEDDSAPVNVLISNSGADAVSESGHAMYPRAPRLPKDASEGTCYLCGRSCSVNAFEGHEWM